MLDLLVVDGYNALRATERYQHIIDEETHPEKLDGDPFVRARERLVTDVAAFAQGRYEAVVVFDGAENLSHERPVMQMAGVSVEFSRNGESADSVIERLVSDARRRGRGVALVTSDNTIRATVGTVVTRISSDLLIREIEGGESERQAIEKRSAGTHMTLEERLSPEEREKLWKLLGRS